MTLDFDQTKFFENYCVLDTDGSGTDLNEKKQIEHLKEEFKDCSISN